MTDVPDMPDPVRRKLLSLTGGLIGSAMFSLEAIAQQARSKSAPTARQPAAEAQALAVKPGPGRRFFTTAEFEFLDELAETIIPADEVSGGARAAKVAEYLDARAGESIDPDFKIGWRWDLAEIDRIAQVITGRPFVRQTPEQRTRYMNHITRREANPKENVEHSFTGVKWQITFVYYKTKIGIHDELKYQGNVIIDEFVGTDVSKP